MKMNKKSTAEKNRSEKVNVNCTVCNKEYQLTRNAISKKKGKPIICIQCTCKRVNKNKKIVNRNKRTWTEDDKLKHSNTMKEVWQDTEYKLKHHGKKLGNQTKEKLRNYNKEHANEKSNASKLLWKNQDYINAQKLGREKFLNDKNYRSKLSQSSKRLWQSETFRAKITASSLKLWQSEAFRTKINNSSQPIISNQHIILMGILDDLNIKYVKEYKLGPWSFDIYIEKYKLLIEVNGDWIHSQKHKQIADRAKSTYILEHFPDLKLKYIWEHEFHAIDRIKSLILYWCGIDDFERVEYNLSSVVVKESTYDESQLLVSKYHYIGNIGRRGLYIGAYLNGGLIATAVFASCGRNESRINNEPTSELTRLVVHPAYQMKNLASWFLSRACKFVKTKWIISFADETHNHKGTIYKACNWSFIKETKPDYWYVDTNGWVMHKKTLWNRASNLKISESEFAAKYGYNKVHGMHKYKYAICIDKESE